MNLLRPTFQEHMEEMVGMELQIPVGMVLEAAELLFLFTTHWMPELKQRVGDLLARAAAEDAEVLQMLELGKL